MGTTEQKYKVEQGFSDPENGGCGRHYIYEVREGQKEDIGIDVWFGSAQIYKDPLEALRVALDIAEMMNKKENSLTIKFSNN